MAHGTNRGRPLDGLDVNKLRDEITAWQRYNGYSNRAFARLAQVDVSSFAKFMRGQTKGATPPTVVKYAKTIGADPRDFYVDPAPEPAGRRR